MDQANTKFFIHHSEKRDKWFMLAIKPSKNMVRPYIIVNITIWNIKRWLILWEFRNQFHQLIYLADDIERISYFVTVT